MTTLPWFEAMDIEGEIVSPKTLVTGDMLLIVMLRGLY